MVAASPNEAAGRCDAGLDQQYYRGDSSVSLTAGNSDRMVLRERLTPCASGTVLAMVGLPARGKSFISRKVERFLQWRGLSTRTFNVGKYRRCAVAAEESGRCAFFEAGNAAAVAARESVARAALADALNFLDHGGRIAILDATNSTVQRRRSIVEQVEAHQARHEGEHAPRPQYSVLFVEALCDDVQVLKANMLAKVSNSPDFAHCNLDEALEDLRGRIANYESVYETVQDDEGPSIKLYNLSSKVMANHCYGRIAKSALPYLMSIHIGARPIWLVRAGAGQGNPQSPGGCDRLSKLSAEGEDFAELLANFIREKTAAYWCAVGKKQEPLQVLTSSMPRAVAMVEGCGAEMQHEQLAALNPIDKGAITGCWEVECKDDLPPWEEVERRYPDFFARLEKDPLRCSFPGGESYMDVIRRLETVLTEVEMCTRPVLIVSHLTTLQPLLAYFRGTPVEQAWQLTFGKNCCVEVTPTAGGGFLLKEHVLSTGPVAPCSPGTESPRARKRPRLSE